jgi:hypothetical protein
MNDKTEGAWLRSICSRADRVRGVTPNKPPSPTNYSNFVHEQNDYSRQCDPDGQRVASEEV